ncbi:MAG: hypothetical protein R3B89_11175 [Polyangiaceae bacterium]
MRDNRIFDQLPATLGDRQDSLKKEGISILKQIAEIIVSTQAVEASFRSPATPFPFRG